MAKTNISIIGAGAMGGAIAKAVAGSKQSWDLTVINAHPEKLFALQSEHPNIAVATYYTPLKTANVVVLAVKPQVFPEVAEQIKSLLNKNTLVVSIMAGVSIQKISKALKIKKVIHAMPNLGAQFGESMTVWSGKGLTPADKKFATSFFETIGEQVFVTNEDLVNKTTAVTASGVGFMAYFIEAYIAEAIALGFKKEQAELLVLQTLKATNTILQKKEQTPAELRVRVTSKKGTTEAGLSVLMGKQFKAILGKTLKTSYKRARELSK
jgi:pyrroline-5-carboxylate reductase